MYSSSQFDKFLNWDVAGDKDRISDPKIAEKRLSLFNEDIITIRNKYNRTKNFDIVIKYAVGCNRIPEGFYRSCYWDKILISPTDNPNEIKNYQYAIILTPRTEKKEVEEAYKELQEHIHNKIEFHKRNILYNNATQDIIEEHVYGAVYQAADLSKFKTLKELDRTREWYWLRLGGTINDKSIKENKYDEIVVQWKRRCPYYGKEMPDGHICEYCNFSDQNIIEHAVSDYINLLNQS